MDSFPDGLVVKKNARVVPLSGDNGTGVPAVAEMEFPAVAEDLSLADDAGGLPLVIPVSEPLRATAEADPLIDVGKASSVDLRRPRGLSGSDAVRGSEEGGSQFDIVTVPELMEHPDVEGFADPPSASQLMQNTGEPRNLENDRLGRRDGMDIPPDIRRRAP